MMRLLISFILLISTSWVTLTIFANTNEEKLNCYLNQIRNNPTKLYTFLKQMPKGGDIHSHLAGAAYPEDLIEYGQFNYLCINPHDDSTYVNNHCPPRLRLENVKNNSALYQRLINAWSMQSIPIDSKDAYRYFFALFSKTELTRVNQRGNILANIVSRAYKDHVSYLELMINVDEASASLMNTKVRWNPHLAALTEALMDNGIENTVLNAKKTVNQIDESKNKRLKCGTTQASAACQVQVNYIYQVIRSQPPKKFYANLLQAFMLADQEPKVVGVTLVGEESDPVAMHDYSLQMEMLNFLHHRYPHVHITLHAGELNDTVPSPQENFHIRQAIEVGQAERIGHGLDIMKEANATQLLQEMKQRHILVEICLTSNAYIWHVIGKYHPLPMYLRYHVPVTLGTDDEGILRTNLTKEYMEAAQLYDLSYSTLKQMVRNSLTYSFLTGKSLWLDPDKLIPIQACAKDKIGIKKPSPHCKAFLQSNQKAQLQWELEKNFTAFEVNFS